MGADENYYRRMNSSYAPNQKQRIPTRACQGRVVIADLPTLGTSPNKLQSGSTTHEAKDLTKSGRPLADNPRARRTVRNTLMNDGPQIATEPPVPHP
jgi:hypothetical protein